MVGFSGEEVLNCRKGPPKFLLTRWFFSPLLIFGLLVPGSEALTRYRFGGAKLENPESGAENLVQLSWDDLDENRFGKSVGVVIEADFIQPVEMDPETNLAPLLLAKDAFSVWTRGRWSPMPTIPLTASERFSSWMVDGEATTVYEDTRGFSYMFDFGLQLNLRRIRFFNSENSPIVVPRFIIGINDGDKRKNGFREHVPPGQSSFDFDILHEGTGAQIIDLELAPTLTRRLLFQIVPKQLMGEETSGIHGRLATPFLKWEVAEFQLFASGFVPFARYTSNVLDLGEELSLGLLNWAGQEQDGTRVEVRMRSGNDEDPNIYRRKTYRGDEEVSYGKTGVPLSRGDYEKLEGTEKGEIGKDLENWSAWSAPYSFGSGEGLAAAEEPRRFVQFDIAFYSTPKAWGQLDYLQFATSSRLVTEARAEINPAAAPSNEMTTFVCKMRAQLEPGDSGFDSIAIYTPALVDAAAGVQGVYLEGVELPFTTSQIDEHGFTLMIPRIDVARTKELVEIVFQAQVFAYGTPFEVRLLDSATPLEVPQMVRAGDADERVDSNTLRVALSRIPQHLIQAMRLSAPAFSPNGDGVNDRVRIEYELLNLSGAVPLTIRVCDLAGRRVAVLERGKSGQSGLDHAVWDGRDGRGVLVPAGLYVLELQVEADSVVERRQRLVALAY